MTEPSGLSDNEAQVRLARIGPNDIRHDPPSLLLSFLKRFWGPIPWMLEAALIFEVVLGKHLEPAIIGALLLFSAVVGSTQERRAKAALDILCASLQVTSQVRRNAVWQFRPARDLVPGDLIRLRAGDLVPADCCLNDPSATKAADSAATPSAAPAASLEVDQSSLTGESATVSRAAGETLYAGSTVRHGTALCTVTLTGARTYYGRTVELVRIASPAGYLERLLFTVVRYLIAIDAALAVLLVAAALWRGEPLMPLVPFLLVLLTATVPITMPAAFTVTNAVEARLLVQQGVLVTGLTAVQEAAAMEVLCVDKTGTLTQNRQTVVRVVPLGSAGINEARLLQEAAAACDEPLQQNQLSLAIHQAAASATAANTLIRVSFTPFDPVNKRSEAIVDDIVEHRRFRVILGSPVVLQQLASHAGDLSRRVEEMASGGARILAVAVGPVSNAAGTAVAEIHGLIALADPPRDEAASLIQSLQRLGIRVLMVTGDTVSTAQSVCRQVGLGDSVVDLHSLFSNLDRNVSDEELLQPGVGGFANCFPDEKFRLIQALQRQQRRVGMTGDGVNDAAALSQADVGIAVQSASDVAKASAKIVLTRSGLQDIVAVVESGRRVYRRMLTWTLTKVARTVELAALLTFGYIAAGVFVMPLFLIVVLAVLNDIVTITLATDQVRISPQPEHWNVRHIVELSSVLTFGWLLVAFLLLWIEFQLQHFAVEQIQTLMFAYLVYSAQATIFLTRVRGRFWSTAPSRFVLISTLGNVLFASLCAVIGVFMTAIPLGQLLATLAATFVTMLVLDQVKIWIYQRTEILAGAPHEREEEASAANRAPLLSTEQQRSVPTRER